MTEQSRLILEAIAEGHSYEQILVQELAWTYHDIFRAAGEALALVAGHSARNAPASEAAGPKAYSVAAIRNEHVQAYVKWDAAQEEELRANFQAGRSVEEIARVMQRQPGAIRSRLEKLGLRRTSGARPSF